MAGILDCRFGGTHTYFGQEFYKPYIGENPRELTTQDARRAIRINIIDATEGPTFSEVRILRSTP